MAAPDWAELADASFALPPHLPAADLLASAFERLSSPDPQERDAQAYVALATWLESGEMDAHFDAVTEEILAAFQAPTIYARAFAPLILAELLGRDAQVRLLTPEPLAALRAAWAQWYLAETDLRSHDPEQGWLHALAHGADAGLAFALHPGLTRADTLELLAVLTHRLEGVAQLPSQWEEDRLALALFAVLTSPRLTDEDSSAWVGALAPRLTPTYGQPRSSAMAFAVQVARSLYIFTLLGAKLPDGQIIPACPQKGWSSELLQTLKCAFPAYPD